MLAQYIERLHKDGRQARPIYINLLTRGILVYARLISHQEFVQSSHRVVQKIAEFYEEAAETIATEADLPLVEVEDDPALFLHLADVKFWTPGAGDDGMTEVGCWRIRSSSIDGFSFHEDIYPSA